jgi:hypothetical protein
MTRYHKTFALLYWGTTTRKQGGYKRILMHSTIEEQFKNISGTFLALFNHGLFHKLFIKKSINA